jgi:putative ABC transport system ATP-binding protein
LTPTRGRILVDEEDLTAATDAGRTEIRRRKIGFVFQRFNLFPTLTADGNLRLAERIHGGNGASDPNAAAKSCACFISKTRCTTSRWSFPAANSSVALARAIVTRPAIILADEPTGNLDSDNSAIVLNMFQELNYRFNQTIVMITHNPRPPRCVAA